MLKFLVCCILLMQGVNIISAKEEISEADTRIPSMDPNPAQNKESNGWSANELNRTNGNLRDSFWADTIKCNVIGTSAASIEISSCICPHYRVLANDQVATDGKSVLKLHLRKLPWNRARRICAEEGGHLAVPQQDSEENKIRELMLVDSVDDVWLGIHDQFEEGDWVTVLDQPVAQTGRARWVKLLPAILNNYNSKKHCARLVSNGVSIDDDACDLRKSFVCNILTL